MRYVGRSVTNNHCEILLQLESGKFDEHEALRCARDASKKMDFHVVYEAKGKVEKDPFSYRRCPYVYIKYGNERGGTNYAYIMVRDTSEKERKKIVIKNKGFPKEDLEVLADLILDELKASGERATNRRESQPCQSGQQSWFQLG